MKITMIRATWIAFMVLAGCSQPQNPVAVDRTPTLSGSTKMQSSQLAGRWQLDQIVQDKITINKPVPYDGKYQIELEFLSNDSLRGTTSRNSLTGTYQIGERNVLAAAYSQTKIAETPWGDVFTDIMHKVIKYRQSPDTLRLSDAQDNALLFKRVSK